MPATPDQTTPFAHVGTGTAVTFTFGTNPVSGSTVSVLFWSYNAGINPTISDNATGNSYVKDFSMHEGTSPTCWIWRAAYINLPASGTLAVTVTFGSAQYIMGCAMSFLNSFAPLLSGQGNSGGVSWTTTSTPSVGANADCLFMGVMATGGGGTASNIVTTSPAVQICTEANGSAFEAGAASYLIADSPQTITWTCSPPVTPCASALDMIVVYDTAPCVPRPVQTMNRSASY